MEEKKIYITPIREGTVIDHLRPGTALKILGVLDVRDKPVTAAMNVESRKMGRKDLIFMEDKRLTKDEINKIALIGRGGTLNLIHNSSILKKEQITEPSYVEGIIKCINPKCITNIEELPAKFHIKQKPLTATCFYCEKMMNNREIINSIK